MSTWLLKPYKPYRFLKGTLKGALFWYPEAYDIIVASRVGIGLWASLQCSYKKEP